MTALRVRLGGFVVFRNNVETLELALKSLSAVCDEIVAIDTGSVDGSADVAASFGVRQASVEWAGFGSARKAAIECLPDVDYVFFLDSDEFLGEGAVRQIMNWKESRPRLPYYSVRRRDWFYVNDSPRFVFRSEQRKRVVRRDAAIWHERMIVHEALPSGPTEDLHATIEHRFADMTSLRASKDRAYALLWAVMNHASDVRLKRPALQYLAHCTRNAIFKGGLWKGWGAGLVLSRQAANYHREKYVFLRQVRGGMFPELVGLYRAGDYSGLFLRVDELLGSLG